MSTFRMRMPILALLCAFQFFFAPPSFAQSLRFPSRPVKIVLGYGPGGSGDVVVRALADKLSKSWGQSVVVVNQPGGNEVVATVAVSHQPADGYTLLFASDSMFVLNPLLRKKLPYDPLKDFVPVTRVFESPLVLFVRQDLPVKDLAGFVSLARQQPGRLNYGTTGTGGTVHLAVAWLSKMYNLDMQAISYNSVAAVTQDMAASRVDFSMLAAGPTMPFVADGKLKALAVTGTKRLDIAPDVPTFAEAGFPGYDSGFYMGLAAPSGTPKPIVDQLAADVREALGSKEMLDLLQRMGLRPRGEAPTQFEQFLESDRTDAQRRVEAARISIE